MTRNPLSVRVGQLCPLLLLLFLAFSVHAQTPEPEITVYETATVEARAGDTVTATVGVVTGETVDRAFNLDLADALRLAPGVSITGMAKSTASPITLRGGDPNFTLVLLDGIPLNDSTDALGGAPDLAAISVEGLDRVEVVQGGASWFYGSSALAGVVQLLTRRPTEARSTVGLGIGDDDRRSASLSLDRASDSGAQQVGPGQRSFGAGLSLNYDEEEGRLFDGETAEQRDAFEATTGLLRFAAVPGARSAVDATVRYVDSEKRDWGEGSGGPVLGSGETRATGQEQAAFSLRYESLPLDGALASGSAASPSLLHQVLVTWLDQETGRVSPAIVPVVPPSTEETDFRQLRASWRSQLEPGAWRPTGGKRGLVGGLEWSLERGESASLLLLPASFGGPVAAEWDFERNTGAAFVEFFQQLSSGAGDWSFEVGARLDSSFDSDIDYDEQLSPRVGARFRPADSSFTFRASWGQAFKLPSFYALASPRALGGNPDLEPETATSSDLGIEWSPTSRLRLGLTGFRARYDDLVDFDFMTFQLVNRNQVDAEGVEARFQWQGSSRFGLRGNLTFQEVEDRDGQDLLRRPEWFGAFEVDFRPGEPLSLVLELEAQGDAFDEQVPVGRNVVDGYELLNFALRLELGQRVTARLRLQNLLDDDYQTQLGFPGVGRSVVGGLRFEL